ncbi:MULTISPECIES: exopolysaccharide biosynthesis polyprenyl glycosylphosphotransferase [unclassified Bacillus cereus group]|uniref:exopolysaccharide biosynthesis polyprenyl glycosylphosphotransferase n=1 Tax=unclassified Bacillus cereus group TaxID=2750818 RepID=UPI0022E76C42|nr:MULTISPECIES: exopolysaccharide biosynthesis polyprenyl glycosylphosphotransferase [unclassified Bacillus cereus group]MDA1779226.1 exopolysaccharide biosynthesis polyprenyl glycosylphosphotransferase [Bacillus cereus group sp. BY9-3LC]MDA2145239.1 exopolysaccharide biosynthesis polyprenyl glycosylphosphotransferase [Bacillus cereus group sp. Bc248]MDA2172661.1 exopolysaccharide biosynthesis polyprenyl glycosylphosphotransferase [Bacillus cereus group sp. Bc247]
MVQPQGYNRAQDVTWELKKERLYNRETRTIYGFIKRCLEIIFSLLLLILTSPLILCIGILVKMESPGPIFYKQERIGTGNKPFMILKIRSMRNDAEKKGPQWANQNDPRVTKIGAFIRKTRIDELPQLINVLKGDMAIIGPRPERKIFIDQFEKEIPDFQMRILVKPGLTGWAQINGGYDITPREKFELDMYYIENESLKLDVLIFIKTIKVVFTGNGAR